jgi:hypothetical protein
LNYWGKLHDFKEIFFKEAALYQPLLWKVKRPCWAFTAIRARPAYITLQSDHALLWGLANFITFFFYHQNWLQTSFNDWKLDTWFIKS